MAGNAKSVKFDPVWFVWGGLDLGYTKGGGTIHYNTQLGNIVVQDVVMAVGVVRMETTINVNLAETNYNRLSQVLGLTLSRGDDLLSLRKTLVMTSISDPTDITTVLDVFSMGNTNANFMLGQERVWPVQFKSYTITPNFLFTETS